MENKKIFTSIGTKIKSVNCIIEFLDDMSKKYDIELEAEYVEILLNHYVSNPVDKNHIVINNDGNQYFCAFLSDDEVLGMRKISKKRNDKSNFTKPKKKRKK